MQVEVGSAALHVVVDAPDGDASATTVVALHAGVADLGSWDDVVPAWTAAGHRVVRYDRRGYGSTTTSAPETFSPVADLLAVMDAADVDRAVLVACSNGGIVALHAGLEHPERVSGLVLVGSAFTGAPWPFGPETPEEDALDEAAETAQAEGRLDEANRLAAHVWLDGPRAAEGRVGGAVRERFLAGNHRAMIAGEAGEATWSDASWDRLRDLDLPVLLLVGEHDFTLMHAWSRAARDRLPRGRYEPLPDTAHLPMLDAPDALADRVLRFVDDEVNSS